MEDRMSVINVKTAEYAVTLDTNTGTVEVEDHDGNWVGSGTWHARPGLCGRVEGCAALNGVEELSELLDEGLEMAGLG